jgi:hypothetical protein
MKNSAKLLLIVAGLTAGCQTGGGGGTPIRPDPRQAALQRFEGEWQSADGAAVSTFSGGIFTTTDTGSGNKVADGSYVLTDDRNVQITVKSLVRGTTSNVACLLATEGQLNCTNASGATFTLTRRGAMPA